MRLNFLSFILILFVALSFASSQEDLIREKVKCVFVNSNETQDCYTFDKKFFCSGIGSCTADIVTNKDVRLEWTSTCGGYESTIVNGGNKDIEFKCDSGTSESTYLTEEIICVFKNSEKEQSCWRDIHVNGEKSCEGIEKCVFKIGGTKGEKMTWKSSCGGYDYTVLDGETEYVEFECLPEGEIGIDRISGKGFVYVYVQCYNGDTFLINKGVIIENTSITYDEHIGEKEIICQSSEDWQFHAAKFCNGKCYGDGSKCGVNSFAVSRECYLEAEDSSIPPSNNTEKEKFENEFKENTEVVLCKDSCPLDGKCYPFGYRKSEEFCSDKGAFVEQLKEESVCENNFECSSNLCLSGKCIEQGLIERILNWFRGLGG